jgi:hypothetical protein
VAALRDELGIVHGALNTAQAENARLRLHVQRCAALSSLIREAIAEVGEPPEPPAA